MLQQQLERLTDQALSQSALLGAVFDHTNSVLAPGLHGPNPRPQILYGHNFITIESHVLTGVVYGSSQRDIFTDLIGF